MSGYVLKAGFFLLAVTAAAPSENRTARQFLQHPLAHHYVDSRQFDPQGLASAVSGFASNIFSNPAGIADGGSGILSSLTDAFGPAINNVVGSAVNNVQSGIESSIVDGLVPENLPGTQGDIDFGVGLNGAIQKLLLPYTTPESIPPEILAQLEAEANATANPSFPFNNDLVPPPLPAAPFVASPPVDNHSPVPGPPSAQHQGHLLGFTLQNPQLPYAPPPSTYTPPPPPTYAPPPPSTYAPPPPSTYLVQTTTPSPTYAPPTTTPPATYAPPTTTPSPSYAPPTTTPSPSYAPPVTSLSPAYAPPSATYAPPQQYYGPPQPSYTPPPPSYAPSTLTTTAPPAYTSPSVTYAPPPSTTTPPPSPTTTPSSAYGPPPPTYSPPSPAYTPPRPSYAPPPPPAYAPPTHQQFSRPPLHALLPGFRPPPPQHHHQHFTKDNVAERRKSTAFNNADQPKIDTSTLKGDNFTSSSTLQLMTTTPNDVFETVTTPLSASKPSVPRLEEHLARLRYSRLMAVQLISQLMKSQY